MQHLKNIVAGNPKTVEQYQLTKNFNVIWLWSEDGKNWYEEVKNFQEDTIKLAYTAEGVIVAIDKDVSAINPEGLSVVELPDITANRRADISGNWMFKDGAVISELIPRKSRGNKRKMKSKACYSSSGIKPSYGTHSYGWVSFPTRINKN